MVDTAQNTTSQTVQQNTTTDTDDLFTMVDKSTNDLATQKAVTDAVLKTAQAMSQPDELVATGEDAQLQPAGDSAPVASSAPIDVPQPVEVPPAVPTPPVPPVPAATPEQPLAQTLPNPLPQPLLSEQPSAAPVIEQPAVVSVSAPAQPTEVVPDKQYVVQQDTQPVVAESPVVPPVAPIPPVVPEATS